MCYIRGSPSAAAAAALAAASATSATSAGSTTSTSSCATLADSELLSGGSAGHRDFYNDQIKLQQEHQIVRQQHEFDRNDYDLLQQLQPQYKQDLLRLPELSLNHELNNMLSQDASLADLPDLTDLSCGMFWNISKNLQFF
jgi:hypothetical protein